MEDINLISWNYKDNPDTFSKMVKKDYSYFEELMENHDLHQYVILITCNRIEIYYYGNKLEKIDCEPVYIDYINSIKHLFRVSSGLESMAIGENDIMRQIKDSYDISSKRGHLNKFLSYTFQKALNIGKDIRTKTDISHGKTSLSTISLDIIDSEYGLGKKNICIIGTGKMATAILNYLIGLKCTLTVSGRSIENARNLAIKYGANYSDLSNINKLISENDIIITGTSSKLLLIKNSDIERIDREKIFIDLSNPPNIEKPLNPLIKFYDLKKIYEISSESIKNRKNEIIKAEKIIDEELNHYANKINEMKSDEIISAFYKYAGSIKNDEILEMKRKVKITPEQEKTINIMMDSFINKILAPYTNNIKNFIKNNERYSYVLKEYDAMLNQLMRETGKNKLKNK
ncbi:MAG: glutamyl-tRNA reductase [Ferroplasma sp.]